MQTIKNDTFLPVSHQRFLEQARWTEQSRRLLFKDTGLTSSSNILEIGCGTGAVISSMYSICPAQYYGFDVKLKPLQNAIEIYRRFSYTCADVYHLPVEQGAFDAVVCHYLLLWLSDPLAALVEMRNATRSGGTIAVMAEPDYGSRIDFPIEFKNIGSAQRESLIKQGANPDIGRSIADLLFRSGCRDIRWGILGSFHDFPPDKNLITTEMEILQSDLSGILDDPVVAKTIERETEFMKMNRRIQFIPTFFAWGLNP